MGAPSLLRKTWWSDSLASPRALMVLSPAVPTWLPSAPPSATLRASAGAVPHALSSKPGYASGSRNRHPYPGVSPGKHLRSVTERKWLHHLETFVGSSVLPPTAVGPPTGQPSGASVFSSIHSGELSVPFSLWPGISSMRSSFWALLRCNWQTKPYYKVYNIMFWYTYALWKDSLLWIN